MPSLHGSLFPDDGAEWAAELSRLSGEVGKWTLKFQAGRGYVALHNFTSQELHALAVLIASELIQEQDRCIEAGLTPPLDLEPVSFRAVADQWREGESPDYA